MDIQESAPIVTLTPAIKALCQKFHVRQLDLFGSAARGDFDPGRSDLDFLVSFQEASPGPSAKSYFGLLEGLSTLFGRPVDLVMDGAVKNPYLRHTIERDRRAIFRAA